MKKPAIIPSGHGDNFTCPDDAFAKKFPALAEMLCDGWWEDKSLRLLSRIGISMGGGVVTVSLSDENFSRSMYTDGQSLEKALKLMNDAIATGTASWRPWKAQKGRK